MNSFDVMTVLGAIAATNSRSDKEELLQRVIGDEFVQKVVTYTYSPFITYGITPPRMEGEGTLQFGADSRLIWSTLDSLADRSISGGHAHQAVMDLMSTCAPAAAELLWRILSKDLKCGITGKTVNKVLPGTVPSFDVMLSQAYEERRVKNFSVPVEPKLDGYRAPCLVADGRGAFFSRVGNHFPALDGLAPAMVEMVQNARDHLQNPIEGMSEKLREVFYKTLGGDGRFASAAVDGEAMTGLFENAGSMRRKGEQADAEIQVFDVLPRKALLDHGIREFKMPFRYRRQLVEFLVAHKPAGAPIFATELVEAHTHEEIQATYERFRAMTLAEYLSRGDPKLRAELEKTTIDKATGLPKVLEGAMVKTWDGFYVKKKGSIWQKMKPEETEDLRVVGAFRGDPHTKYENCLGGVIVDRQGVQVRVGGGFSDKQREELWLQYELDVDDPDNRGLIGRLIEVEFNEVTPDGSLRHPRFVRFRDDKDETLKAA